MPKPSHADELDYSPIVVVAQTLSFAFSSLGASKEPIFFENLSVFINHVYGTRNRSFHDIFHALDVSKKCSPVGRLAALFHDAVYIQVDRSRTPELRALFGIFNPSEKLEMKIPDEATLHQDLWAKALCEIFGLLPGDILAPFSGLNEFLSAWVAIQKLRDHLPRESTLKIAVCIEATIPFRTRTQSGKSIPEQSADRLERTAHFLGLTLSEEEIDETVNESVRVSNNDVVGFGLEEPDVFIYNSWALLYEANPALQSSFYLLSHYRESLQKLQFFLENLSPRKIFREYKGFPDQLTLKHFIEGAGRNLRISREYVKAKILDTAVLEAFADLSGGDCPLELLTGPRPRSRESKTARIETLLNWKPQTTDHHHPQDEKVSALLNEGRAYRSRFDLKTSLFASYLYTRLSTDEFSYSCETANEYLKGEITAETFLRSFPTDLVINVGTTLSQLAWTRQDRLLAVVALFQQTSSAA